MRLDEVERVSWMKENENHDSQFTSMQLNSIQFTTVHDSKENLGDVYMIKNCKISRSLGNLLQQSNASFSIQK